MKELNKEQLDWLSANYPNEEFKMVNLPGKNLNIITLYLRMVYNNKYV